MDGTLRMAAAISALLLFGCDGRSPASDGTSISGKELKNTAISPSDWTSIWGTSAGEGTMKITHSVDITEAGPVFSLPPGGTPSATGQQVLKCNGKQLVLESPVARNHDHQHMSVTFETCTIRTAENSPQTSDSRCNDFVDACRSGSYKVRLLMRGVENRRTAWTLVETKAMATAPLPPSVVSTLDRQSTSSEATTNCSTTFAITLESFGENVAVELRAGSPGKSSVVGTRRTSGGNVLFDKLCPGDYFVAIGNGETVSITPVRTLEDKVGYSSNITVRQGSGNIVARSRSTL
jgi:hypothetical protein